MNIPPKIGILLLVGLFGGGLLLFWFLPPASKEKKAQGPQAPVQATVPVPHADSEPEGAGPQWAHALPSPMIGALPDSLPPRTQSVNALPDIDDFAFDGARISDKAPEGNGIIFENGDLYDLYGGGRDTHPSNTPTSKDNRLWLDARIPIEVSNRLKLFGVSTVMLGDTDAATLSDYTRNYGIGGGIGLSYKLSPNAEIDFDYRHTKALEARNDDPATDAAGISLRLRF